MDSTSSQSTQHNYKCVVITPAGRKRYIEILYKYLKAQRSDFSSWQLWLNTTNEDDLQYMQELERENTWITCIKPSWPIRGNYSIGYFFRHTLDPNTVYIRLDDDVVYLTPDFIRTLYAARLATREPLFVYPNIINNAVISHLHYKNCLVNYPTPPTYNCLDTVGWKDGKFAEVLHCAFLDSLRTNRCNNWTTSYNNHVPINYARVSINSIAWFGNDMAHIYTEIPMGDEEQNISVTLPKKYNRPNLIVNYPVCAHFAFFTQRVHLEEHTDILQQYSTLAQALE